MTRSIPRPNWLPETVWPFETFGLEADGSVLAVTDAGRGPVLLLVHTGAWSFIWRDLMVQLAGNFRCVCFDAPGNGRSSDLRSARSPLENAARAVTGVIEELGLDDLTLVAHDLGGIAGLAGAARVPERVRGIVAMNAFGWKPVGAAFHNYLRDARHCDALYGEIARALAGPFAELPLMSIFGERNDPFGFQSRWKKLFPGAVQRVVAQGNHYPMCDAPAVVAEWDPRLASRARFGGGKEMNARLAAGAAQMLSMIVFVTVARRYVAPWLKTRGRADALIALVGIHVFRYVALQSFGAQMAGFPISNGTRDELVYGDLLGMLLATIAILALRRRSRLAIPLVWVLVVETATDTVLNVAAGVREHLFGLATGLAWLVISFYVPALMVSLGLMAWQLFSRRGEPLVGVAATGSRLSERQMAGAVR